MPISNRPPAEKLGCLRVERKDPDMKILLTDDDSLTWGPHRGLGRGKELK